MSVSKVYCKAFYESILPQVKKSSDTFNKIKSEMAYLEQLIHSSRELQTALMSPATAPKEKQGILKEVAKKATLSKEFTNFLQLLALKGRVAVLFGLPQVFEEIHLENEGGVMGDLVSAERLQPEDVADLERSFSMKMGKKTKFREKVDPAVLAGVRVTVSGTTYDGTLKAQLARLRNKFLEMK